MGQLLLLLVVALTVAAVVFGVTVLVTGRDPGLAPVEPDGRAVPLPGGRPLAESDIGGVRFDTALRGYRMDQVDQAMRRAAYDIGYKSELIGVLEAEVDALREGRTAEAEKLREARLAAGAATTAVDPAGTTEAASGGEQVGSPTGGPTATTGDAPTTAVASGDGPTAAAASGDGPTAAAATGDAPTTAVATDDVPTAVADRPAGVTGDAEPVRRPAGQGDVIVRSESV